jgi:hypothetical protein
MVANITSIVANSIAKHKDVLGRVDAAALGEGILGGIREVIREEFCAEFHDKDSMACEAYGETFGGTFRETYREAYRKAFDKAYEKSY